MDLKVLGCHGASTPQHRTSCFLVDKRLAIDAGSLTNTLSLQEQNLIETVLVSHTHLDHIRDLGFLVDNRFQMGGPSLEIAAIPSTIAALHAHMFNDRLWPDFTKIEREGEPVLRFRELEPGSFETLGEFRVKPVLVNHTVDTSGFVIEHNQIALAYSGDTGPTDDFWRELNQQDNLRALLVDVSFPNAQSELANRSKHYTPETLDRDLKKLKRADEIELLIFHIKPAFESAVIHDLLRMRERTCSVLQLDEERHFGAK